MFKPKLVFKSGCPDNKVKAFDYALKWVGWRGTYSGSPDYTSNAVWVGEAEISSNDAAFSDTGGTWPDKFDIDDSVNILLTQNPKFTHWKGVVRDEKTLEEYETGWNNVNNSREFRVSELWEDKTGAPFNVFRGYKATIWVDNQQCIAWKSLNMFFVTCPWTSGCKLQDQELSLRFYPNPATENIILQGLDDIHQGDRMEATIIDGMGKMVKRIPNLQKTQISVSDLTAGMYYLSVFRNQNRISTEKLIVQ